LKELGLISFLGFLFLMDRGIPLIEILYNVTQI